MNPGAYCFSQLRKLAAAVILRNEDLSFGELPK